MRSTSLSNSPFKWITIFFLACFCNSVPLNAQIATVPFVTSWKTDNLGFSNDDQILLPLNCNSCTVDWGDGEPASIETASPVHTYTTPGTYTISVTGTFSQFEMGFGNNDAEKLLTIDQWGDAQWSTMVNAFSKCTNVQGNFTDRPDLSSVTSMANMFDDAESFNYPINNWDVSNVTIMSNLFADASIFNQDLTMWNVSNVTNMTRTFNGARAFDGDISTWNVGKVTMMNSMFLFAVDFNGDLSSWNVSNVRFMDSMFAIARPFNSDISGWDTRRVQTMRNMFIGCGDFDQDLSGWVVDSVTDMGTMFQNADVFNSDISGWNVSRVTRMNQMFSGANTFNADISGWRVDSVTNMRIMFSGATSFDQNLGDWNVSNVVEMDRMFDNVTLSTANYDSLLIGWNAQNLQPGLVFSGGNSLYCAGENARQNMIDASGWTITDGGPATTVDVDDLLDQNVENKFTFPVITGTNLTGNEKYYLETNGGGVSYEAGDVIRFEDFISYPGTIFIYDAQGATCFDEESFELTIVDNKRPYVTTWKTDNPGMSNDDQITLYLECDNCVIDWGDNNTTIETGQGSTIHTYPAAGTYTISISGGLTRTYMGGGNNPDAEKLITIEQWGDIEWLSMQSAFADAVNLDGNFTDAPDLSNVTTTLGMFENASSFNHPINNWDVSNITNMSFMFSRATSFNEDLSNWDMSNVELASFMFNQATAFNGNIDNWDVSRVKAMASMFSRTKAFNRDIGGWDVDSVLYMNSMFHSSVFNRDIGSWEVGQVVEMQNMFWLNGEFDQDISGWDVSQVTDMDNMFSSARMFNQDLSQWDVGNVQDMGSMFVGTPVFTSDLSNWDVSRVKVMRSMFVGSLLFNSDLSSWKVDSVTRMDGMFRGANSFDSDISGWNTSSVTDMESMFAGAISFDQNLGDWDMTNVTDVDRMFEGITLSTINYDSILIGWNAQNLQPNLIFNGGDSKYCAGEVARQNMIDSDGWQISDDGSATIEVNDLTDQNTTNSFTLPAITGTDLSGNEKYYLETNGQGVSYEIGDIIRFEDIASYPVTIFIYDELGASCSDEENFELTITPTITCDIIVDDLLNETVTGTFTLPVITGTNLTGNQAYYTGINGTGTTYEAGDIINYDATETYPITIYIYDELDPSCFDEESFELTLTPSTTCNINIDDLLDETLTDVFTLPVITGTNLTGNQAYYTGINGTGTTYETGDIINYDATETYPITIYIYDELDPSCFDEESFELTLTPSTTCNINIDDLLDETVTDVFTLPVITGTDLTGNQAYYSETNGTGTSYNVGDIINYDPTETYPIILYIYDEIDATCSSEESFELIILPPTGLFVDSVLTNRTLSTDSESCTRDTDNLPTPNITSLVNTISHNAPAFLPLGETTITWTAVGDISTETRTQTITIRDREDPIPDTEMLETIFGGCEGITTIDPPIATDNCSSSSITGTTATTFPITKTGETTVTWKFEDDAGNISEQTQTVMITGCNLIFVESFSPNGDEVNDTWKIGNYDPNEYPNSSLEIVNRLGKKVYELNSYQNDWDGTSSITNEDLPIGTYYYVFKTGEEDDVFTGYLFIKR